MAKVTKSTMIGELLRIDENIAPLLLGIGMHCLGCPSSQMETIEEAAMVHGVDPDGLVEDINNFVEQQGEERKFDSRDFYCGGFFDTFLYILYHTAYSSAKTSSALEETITL